MNIGPVLALPAAASKRKRHADNLTIPVITIDVTAR